jgi:hypothetical protein
MADGRPHTVTVKAMQDIIICMNKAYYIIIATFLMIDNLGIDYPIGWPFMLQYDVQLKPLKSLYVFGLTQNQVLDS